jgi:hypothetical protein
MCPKPNLSIHEPTKQLVAHYATNGFPKAKTNRIKAGRSNIRAEEYRGENREEYGEPRLGVPPAGAGGELRRGLHGHDEQVTGSGITSYGARGSQGARGPEEKTAAVSVPQRRHWRRGRGERQQESHLVFSSGLFVSERQFKTLKMHYYFSTRLHHHFSC